MKPLKKEDLRVGMIVQFVPGDGWITNTMEILKIYETGVIVQMLTGSKYFTVGNFQTLSKDEELYSLVLIKNKTNYKKPLSILKWGRYETP